MWLKLAKNKDIYFHRPVGWGETGMQFKPHPLQYINEFARESVRESVRASVREADPVCRHHAELPAKTELNNTGQAGRV